MSIAHHRKKQPVVVRQLLLDEAAQLAVERGLAGLTLDAVAREAGVSKGGLLHHFPSKQALFDALCDEYLRRLERRIARAMSADALGGEGCFTRAYLTVMASGLQGGKRARRWARLRAMLLAEPLWRERWQLWLEQQVAQHADEDAAAAGWLVRLAADGLWLADLTPGGAGYGQARGPVLDALRAMTFRH